MSDLLLDPAPADSVDLDAQQQIARDRINELLAELGARLGLEDLKLDAADHCGLEVDEAVTIDLILPPERPVLIVASKVGTLGANRDSTRLRRLLAANFMWYGTDGGTLGLSNRSEVVLHREMRLPSDLDVTTLQSRLSDFVILVEDWQFELARSATD